MKLKAASALFILTSVVFSNSLIALETKGHSPNWAQHWPATELYDSDCGPLWRENKYGPFDYQKATPSERALVDGAHFDLEYDTYLKGELRSLRQRDALPPAPPAGGFSYTLWAFPNHHRALAAMEDLGFRNKTERPRAAQFRIHCYFQRAVRFDPNDALVRAIYGYYYARRGKPKDAQAQLEKIDQLEPLSKDVYVYSAFAYLEMKKLDQAFTAAKRAYEMGHSQPGLRDRLRKLGAWQDSPPDDQSRSKSAISTPLPLEKQ